jgi:hypothetical protein
MVSILAQADPPPLTPIQFLPGDLRSSVAPGNQTAPSIAMGANQMLAVWTDASSSHSLAGVQSEADIFAARLDSSGNLIDTTPIVVRQDGGYQRNPRVSWNGENWLVLWENQTFTGSYYETRVFGARVSPQGIVLDTTPLQPFGTNLSEEVHVTANGSEWLVVTQGHSAGQAGIRARRIASDGSYPDPAAVVLVPETFYVYFSVQINSAAGEYLLTYTDPDVYRARRYTSSLQPIGNPFTIPNGKIASNGPQYYLLFSGGQFGNEMRGSPMSPSGVLTIPGGAFFDDLSDGTWWESDVAWDGTYWWISYVHAWTGITYQRATVAGTVVDPTGFAIDPPNRNYHAAHHTAGRPVGGVVTLWQDWRISTADYNVFATRVSGPTPPLDPGAPICLSGAHQLYADVAAGPGFYMLACASAISGDTRIQVQRIDEVGTVLDAQPIVVASGPNEAVPAVAWNGSVFLVVWNSAGNIVGRRVNPDGSFVDGNPVTIMPGGSPDVAALGTDFLTVATHAPGNPQYRFAYARRVSGATGQPIDPAPILIGGSFAQFCRVTTFGGRWLAAWQQNFTHDDPQAAISAAFVAADGSTPGPFTVLPASGGTPDIAVSDDTALFIWRNNSLANANNYIAARRMRPDGSFVDPGAFLVDEAAGRQLDPVSAWNGHEFVTAWEDQRNQQWFFDALTDIYGARVPADGAVTDPSGYAIFDEPSPVVNPAIASLGNGRWIVAGSIFRTGSPFDCYRIGYRIGLGDVADVIGSDAPERFRGLPAQPNPTSSTTMIRFDLPTAADVRLLLYDAGGRLVRRIAGGTRPPGSHSVNWDGRDDTGRTVPDGVYLMRLEAGRFADTQKVIKIHGASPY